MYESRHAGFVLHRTQAATVEQFHGRHGLAFKHGDGVAAGLDIREHDQRRSLVRVVDHGVVGHRADKAQGTFAAHQQVAEDIQRVVEIHQGIKGQACGVFQTVFVADFCSQFSVGAGFASQRPQLLEQWPVALAKGGDVGGIFGVDPGTVGQHYAQARQGVVGVLRGAATHAAGIIGDDAANFAGVDRCRVWADLASERGQPGVGLGADHSRLQADLPALAADFLAVPVVAEHDQHRVADGLAREAGARCAKGHRYLIATGQAQQFDHFIFGLDANHQLGDQSVKARIGAERQGRQRIGKTAVLGDQSLGITHKGGGQAHASSRISTIRSLGPWAP